MSLPQSDLDKAARFALLGPEAVEIPHPTIPGYFIAGWAFRADELYSKGDGFKMLRAIERLYGMKWRKLRLGFSAIIAGRW